MHHFSAESGLAGAPLIYFSPLNIKVEECHTL